MTYLIGGFTESQYKSYLNPSFKPKYSKNLKNFNVHVNSLNQPSLLLIVNRIIYFVFNFLSFYPNNFNLFEKFKSHEFSKISNIEDYKIIKNVFNIFQACQEINQNELNEIKIKLKETRKKFNLESKKAEEEKKAQEEKAAAIKKKKNNQLFLRDNSKNNLLILNQDDDFLKDQNLLLKKDTSESENFETLVEKLGVDDFLKTIDGQNLFLKFSDNNGFKLWFQYLKDNKINLSNKDQINSVNKNNFIDFLLNHPCFSLPKDQSLISKDEAKTYILILLNEPSKTELSANKFDHLLRLLGGLDRKLPFRCLDILQHPAYLAEPDNHKKPLPFSKEGQYAIQVANDRCLSFSYAISNKKTKQLETKTIRFTLYLDMWCHSLEIKGVNGSSYYRSKANLLVDFTKNLIENHNKFNHSSDWLSIPFEQWEPLNFPLPSRPLIPFKDQQKLLEILQSEVKTSHSPTKLINKNSKTHSKKDDHPLISYLHPKMIQGEIPLHLYPLKIGSQNYELSPVQLNEVLNLLLKHFSEFKLDEPISFHFDHLTLTLKRVDVENLLKQLPVLMEHTTDPQLIHLFERALRTYLPKLAKISSYFGYISSDHVQKILNTRNIGAYVVTEGIHDPTKFSVSYKIPGNDHFARKIKIDFSKKKKAQSLDTLIKSILNKEAGNVVWSKKFGQQINLTFSELKRKGRFFFSTQDGQFFYAFSSLKSLNKASGEEIKQFVSTLPKNFKSFIEEFNDKVVWHLGYSDLEINALATNYPLLYSLIEGVGSRNALTGFGSKLEFKEQNGTRQLLQEGKKFLEKHSLSNPQFIPSSSTSLGLLKDALTQYQGVFIGEWHSDPAPKKYIMDYIKENKVECVFLEHLMAHMQDELDNYWLSDNLTMPCALEAYLDSLDRGFQLSQFPSSNFKALIKALKQANIRPIALDTRDSYRAGYTQMGSQGPERMLGLNYQTHLIIEKEKVKGKWIALVGGAHTSKYEGIPGMREIENIPNFLVKKGTEKPSFNIPHYQTKNNEELGFVNAFIYYPI